MPITQKIKGVHYVKREFAICAQLCYGERLNDINYYGHRAVWSEGMSTLDNL